MDEGQMRKAPGENNSSHKQESRTAAVKSNAGRELSRAELS
jgi:hypothetical protein